MLMWVVDLDMDRREEDLQGMVQVPLTPTSQAIVMVATPAEIGMVAYQDLIEMTEEEMESEAHTIQVEEGAAAQPTIH